MWEPWRAEEPGIKSDARVAYRHPFHAPVHCVALDMRVAAFDPALADAAARPPKATSDGEHALLHRQLCQATGEQALCRVCIMRYSPESL